MPHGSISTFVMGPVRISLMSYPAASLWKQALSLAGLRASRRAFTGRPGQARPEPTASSRRAMFSSSATARASRTEACTVGGGSKEEGAGRESAAEEEEEAGLHGAFVPTLHLRVV